MIRKLLYLNNNGFKPLKPVRKGKGGLGYHLPQYRKIMHGDGIDRYFSSDGDLLNESDDGDSNSEIRDHYDNELDEENNTISSDDDDNLYEIGGRVYYDEEGNIEQIYKKNPDYDPDIGSLDDEYIYDEDYIADEIYKLEKQHKSERHIVNIDKELYETSDVLYKDIELIKASKSKNESKFYKNKILKDIKGLTKPQLNGLLKKDSSYNQLKKFTIEKKLTISPNYKQPIDLINIQRLYDELDEAGKSLIDKILKYKKLNKQIEELEKIKNTNADQSIVDYATSKLAQLNQEQEIDEKLPEFVLPIEPESYMTTEEKKMIIQSDIIINDDDKKYVPTILRNMTKQINKISKVNPYDTIGNIKPDLGYRDMMNNVSIAGIESELGVYVDDKFYKGEGGKDWEMQAEHNTELLKEIVKESLGEGYEFISMQPQSNTKNDTIDIIMEVKNEHDETEFINLELKKYAHNPKYSDYSTIQSIYDNDSYLFNEWFYIFKDKLTTVQKGCSLSGDYTNYIELLSSISTDGKIDNKKMLDEYVKSGKYFSLPLTVTKIKTPTIEQIKNSKYDNDAFIKYLYHGKRKNKSENKLLVGFAIEDAILFDNINNRFNPDINPAIQTLNIVYNAYGKNKQDAYGYPACYLSVLKPHESIQQGFLSRDAMKQKRTLAIQKAKALKALKPQQEEEEYEDDE